MQQKLEDASSRAFRPTTLLSDAPSSAHDLEPWRNRRVHWSSLVGQFSQLYLRDTIHLNASIGLSVGTTVTRLL